MNTATHTHQLATHESAVSSWIDVGTVVTQQDTLLNHQDVGRVVHISHEPYLGWAIEIAWPREPNEIALISVDEMYADNEAGVLWTRAAGRDINFHAPAPLICKCSSFTCEQ